MLEFRALSVEGNSARLSYEEFEKFVNGFKPYFAFETISIEPGRKYQIDPTVAYDKSAGLNEYRIYRRYLDQINRKLAISSVEVHTKYCKAEGWDIYTLYSELNGDMLPDEKIGIFAIDTTAEGRRALDDARRCDNEERYAEYCKLKDRLVADPEFAKCDKTSKRILHLGQMIVDLRFMEDFPQIAFKYRDPESPDNFAIAFDCDNIVKEDQIFLEQIYKIIIGEDAGTDLCVPGGKQRTAGGEI